MTGYKHDVLAVARWIYLTLAKSAPCWATWLAFLAAPLLARALTPRGAGPIETEWLLAWLHPAGLAGVVLGLVPLARGGAFLARIPPRTRWAGELLALLTASAHLQLPTIAAACATGFAPADLWRAVPAILLTDLRLAATALLLLVPPLSTPARVAAFLAAAWLLPALAARSPALGRATAWLDAGATGTGLEFAAGLAAALTLLLAGYLLRTRSAAAEPRPR